MTRSWNSEWDERFRNLALDGAIACTETLAYRDPGIGATLLRVGKGYAAFHGRDAAMSAASFIGIEAENHLQQLEAVEAFYKAHSTTPRIWATPGLAHPDFIHLLEMRGYVPKTSIRAWIRNAQTSCSFDLPANVSIRTVNQEDAAVWVNTVALGFLEDSGSVNEVPKNLADVFFSLGFARGFTPLLAFEDERPVGGGVLAMGNGVAMLRTTSTRFQHRSKGVQKALMAARIKYANKNRCEFCISNTSVNANDPSARNMALFGFQELRTSTLFEKAVDV